MKCNSFFICLRRLTLIAYFSFLSLVFSSLLFSQEKDSLWLNEQWYFQPDDSTSVDLNILLPPIVRDQLELKKYIRDPRFFQLRTAANDTLAVDAIFDKAMILAQNDISHALLIATLATMDHFRLGVKIPLLGTLYFPLTTETKKTFALRHQHLPKNILPDAEGKRKKDKDKLQHFFGSAYFTYITHSPWLAALAGNFVEWGEEHYIVDGAWDERDRAANEYGREFGKRLAKGEDLLPSDVLWK